MSFKNNFLWLFWSKIFSVLCLFLAGSLINRKLGPSNIGIFAEMQTWVNLFLIIFGISLDSAIYHFANTALYGNDNKSRFVTIGYLSFIFSVIGVFMFTLFIIFKPDQFSATTARLTFLLSILIIFTMVSNHLNIFLQALNKIKSSALVGVIQSAANISIITFGFLMGLMNIRFIIVSMVIVQIITLLTLGVIFKQMSLFRGNFSKTMAIGMIKTGLKQHVATIATFIYAKINQLIIFRICGERESGIFAVALSLALAFTFIPMTFQSALFPRVIHFRDDREITLKSLKFIFFAWGIITLLILLFAKPIIIMYAGSEFVPSVRIFKLLLFMTWILPLSSMITPYYTKLGAFNAASFTAVILALISIGLNLLLVPRFASFGAALSSSLTCILGFFSVLWLFRYLTKKHNFFLKNSTISVG